MNRQKAGVRPIDAATVEGIRKGDETAFARLYDAYFTYLCATASGYIHDLESAKDLVNELFVRIWDHREYLRQPVHPYIMTALRNACLNYLRQARSHSDMLDAWKELSEFQIDRVYEVTPLDYASAMDLIDRVEAVAATLPGRCREIFGMYFNRGMKASEIADILGLAQSSVRVQLKIALDRIRAALEEK